MFGYYYTRELVVVAVMAAMNKPRGRPPKNSSWNPYEGRYERTSAAAAAPKANTPKNTLNDSEDSWDSDEMNEVVFNIGNRTNPYRKCTSKKRGDNGLYKEGAYSTQMRSRYRDIHQDGHRFNDTNDVSPPSPDNLSRLLSDEGKSIFEDAFSFYGDDVFEDTFNCDRRDIYEDEASLSVFVITSEMKLNAWYKSKTNAEKEWLDNNVDADVFMSLALNGFDNILKLNGL